MQTQQAACRYCRVADLRLHGDQCPVCGRTEQQVRSYESLRRAGHLTVSDRSTNRKRHQAFALGGLLGLALVLLGIVGHELVLVAMGTALTLICACAFYGRVIVRFLIEFTNSRAGRFSVGASLALISVLVIISASQNS